MITQPQLHEPSNCRMISTPTWGRRWVEMAWEGKVILNVKANIIMVMVGLTNHLGYFRRTWNRCIAENRRDSFRAVMERVEELPGEWVQDADGWIHLWIMTEKTVWWDWEMIQFTPEQRKELAEVYQMRTFTESRNVSTAVLSENGKSNGQREVWKVETCHFFILSINSIFHKLLYITHWGCHSYRPIGYRC